MAISPASAIAEDKPFLGDRAEATLDFNGDGKMDRAVVVLDSDGGSADFSIYLANGERRPDLSPKPSFHKKAFPIGRILIAFEGNGKRSLIVIYGCGGCSNDYSTTLTIAYRHGEFLVAGYTYAWETRTSAGACDINFLTGEGTISVDLGPARRIAPVGQKFRPVKLADSTDDMRPEACDL